MYISYKHCAWLLLALGACKKEIPPIQDINFEMRYDSSGMRGVNVQFGLSPTSYTVANASPDLLTGTLTSGPNGSITSTGRYRSGDHLYGYVKFLDITNPANAAPAMASYMSAVCYINKANAGTTALVLRYEDYYNSPQKRYVDKDGKTNLVVEQEYLIP